jgi:putative nucleotidyltransferase with HDIG domain
MNDRQSNHDFPDGTGFSGSTLERDLKARALSILRAVQSPETNLPTLPAVAVEISRLTQDETSSATDLERLILTDQTLTSKLLSVANSAYYGRRGTVDTVRQAVVLLGFEAVQDLVLGVSLIGLFDPTLQVPGVTMKGLWAHSIAVAAASAALAEAAPKPLARDRAFVAGLLHDIGRPLLLTLFPDYFTEAAAYAQEKRVCWLAAERATLNITHDVLGDTFARASFFPNRLQAGIADHHEPDLSADPVGLDVVVHLADYLVITSTRVGPGDLPPPPLAPGTFARLGLDEDQAVRTVASALANTEAIVDQLL